MKISPYTSYLELQPNALLVPQIFYYLQKVGVTRWRCLWLVSLLVGLHIVEGLQHGLHKLILGGDQLFKVDIVVGVVVVAGLAIALVIPSVHHLMVW
jgi:hypothetical protein